jgi:hypothetical protein
MYTIISFGYRCSAAGIIKALGLKTESYPFDWMISSLPVIKDCIETNFAAFTDSSQYTTHPVDAYNHIDYENIYICKETMTLNNYYNHYEDGKTSYQYCCALNHHKMPNDLEYFKRCIERLYGLFTLRTNKFYLHFSRIIGPNTYNATHLTILNEFREFSAFIQQKTINIFGLYFILIKGSSPTESIVQLLESTSEYAIYSIWCNPGFIDGGETFMGECTEEYNTVTTIIKNYLK